MSIVIVFVAGLMIGSCAGVLVASLARMGSDDPCPPEQVWPDVENQISPWPDYTKKP